MTLENGVVELVDLIRYGFEDDGSLPETAEFGEETDKLRLEDVLRVEAILDD